MYFGPLIRWTSSPFLLNVTSVLYIIFCFVYLYKFYLIRIFQSFRHCQSLDAGSAWTSMALHLFQHDSNALQTVRNELNYIERQYGTNFFFTIECCVRAHREKLLGSE